MDHSLEDTIALLSRTPAAVNALLRGLSDDWADRNEGGSTWTAKEVVAHLAHAERSDWLPRIRCIIDKGETCDLPPFDREGFRDFSSSHTLSEVLDDFTRARFSSLESLAFLSLKPEDMERRGRHPSFGPVTLGQLLATWAAHDANHLHQIARVLSHQYREAVGPWSAFLGVLHCNAHGA